LSTALTAALLTGLSAKADTVNMQYMGTGNGRVVRISINSMSKNVFAGRPSAQRGVVERIALIDRDILN
jgi:hypothetical protein